MTTATPSVKNPQFRTVGDSALLVEFGSAINDTAHDAVLSLDSALSRHPFEGLQEAVPAFVNLLVVFDPGQTDHAQVEAHLRDLLLQATRAHHRGKAHQVDVCYNGPDLPEVARLTGLSVDEVIAHHLAGHYSVYLYGFAPGYAYLGGVVPELQVNRKPAPVRGVPAGSVMIAGAQCLVTTLTMPSGWWVIGHSSTCVLTSDPARPFLFDVGDSITFHRVATIQATGRG